MYGSELLDFSSANADSFALISHRKIGDKLWDVTAKLTRDTDVAALKEEFLTRMGGNAIIVNDTFRVVDEAHKVARFVAKQVPRVRDYNDSANLVYLGNNQFCDKEDTANIWSVVEDGGQKALVCTSKDDLEDLLAENTARFPVTANHLAQPVAAVNGDFASVILDDGSVKKGVVVDCGDKAYIVDTASQNFTPFRQEQVVESVVTGHASQQQADLASLTSAELAKFWDYMSRIYPKDYIAKWKAAVGR